MNSALASVPRFAPSSERGPSFQALLALFAGACRCACLTGRPPDAYAFPLATLLNTGVAHETLQGLIQRGYLKQHQESPRLEGKTSPGRSAVLANGNPNAAFVLTVSGVAWVEGASVPTLGVFIPQKPSWCAPDRELTFQGLLIKRYRRPAYNQFLILDSFEELGWIRQIDDPLPHDFNILPEERLEETVKSLNRLLLHPLLRFTAIHDRRGVRWEATPCQ